MKTAVFATGHTGTPRHLDQQPMGEITWETRKLQQRGCLSSAMAVYDFFKILF